MDAKKAWERPVPSVRGIPAGSEEGTTQPTMASARVDKFTSNLTPSEISKSMRGVWTEGDDGGATTRAPAKVERMTKI